MSQVGTDGRFGVRSPVKTTFLPAVTSFAMAMAAMLISAAPASAAAVVNSYDVCSALRTGASLASVEASLVARGYSAFNAGTLTGTTIKNRCPDQAAKVIARLTKARA